MDSDRSSQQRNLDGPHSNSQPPIWQSNKVSIPSHSSDLTVPSKTFWGEHNPSLQPMWPIDEDGEKYPTPTVFQASTSPTVPLLDPERYARLRTWPIVTCIVLFVALIVIVSLGIISRPYNVAPPTKGGGHLYSGTGPQLTATVHPKVFGVTPLPEETPTVRETRPIVTPKSDTPVPLLGNANIYVDDNEYGSGMNQFDYVGDNWLHQTNKDNSWYGNTISADNHPGDNVSIHFTGNRIIIYGITRNNAGNPLFTLRDSSGTIIFQREVDLYKNLSTSDSGQQAIFDTYSTDPNFGGDLGVLPVDTYTLTMVVVRDRNSFSNGYYLVIDDAVIYS
jgi:hypothetical protein